MSTPDLLKQVDENLADFANVPDSPEILAARAFLHAVRAHIVQHSDPLRRAGTAQRAVEHFTNLVNAYCASDPNNAVLQKLRDVGLPTVVAQMAAE